MRSLMLVSGALLLFGCSQQQSSSGSYSSSTYSAPKVSYGCTSGDCENGNGTYTTKEGSKYSGNWISGKPNGEFSYTSSRGITGNKYYDNGADITEKVENCRKAKKLSDGYAATVGGINVALNLLTRGKVGGSYEWGKNAANKQTVPRGVAIYCN